MENIIIVFGAVIVFLSGVLIYQFEIIKRQRKELAQHLTDHIEVPEVKLPTEVAALQELVRKYELLMAYKDNDQRDTLRSWKEEQDLRFAAEEESKKKDFQIHELMSDNMDYINQRDNAIKQLEELKAEIEKHPRWRRNSNQKTDFPA